MLKKIFFLVVIATLTTIFTGNKAKAQDMAVNSFYDQLSPYGHWENLPLFGWAWQPFNIQPGWKPYSDGYWVYTENGWTYQADNNWGWAVYHYGRWTYDQQYGWYWIPGSVWGPAWVAWRNNDNYIGWAPLPPQAVWNGSDFNSGFNFDQGIPWYQWNFVENGFFNDRYVYSHIQNPARNVTFFNSSRNITNYRFNNNRIFNFGFDVNVYEHLTNRRIERYNMINADSYHNAGFSRENPHEMRIYRPEFNHNNNYARPIEHRDDMYSHESRDDMQRRHDIENNQFNDHNNRANDDLRIHHEQELKNNQNNNRLKEINNQHEAETRAFNDRQNQEKQIINNRQQSELRNQSNNSNNQRQNPPANQQPRDNHQQMDNKQQTQPDNRNQNNNQRQTPQTPPANQQPRDNSQRPNR